MKISVVCQGANDTKVDRTYGGDFTSENFRRGRGSGRIQDFLTPREREERQQRQNEGARYGWQQQYNMGRGNVRRGSSNDFRRGARTTRAVTLTPREREMRQMRDNRELGRYGRDGIGYDRGGEDYYERDDIGYGRDGIDYGRADYDINDRIDDEYRYRDNYGSGRDNGGRRDENAWGNFFRGMF